MMLMYIDMMPHISRVKFAISAKDCHFMIIAMVSGSFKAHYYPLELTTPSGHYVTLSKSHLLSSLNMPRVMCGNHYSLELVFIVGANFIMEHIQL